MIPKSTILLTTGRVRVLTVCFYLACNVYAVYYSLFLGELIGDFRQQLSPNPTTSTLIFVAVMATYLLVLFPLFDEFTRLTGASGPSLMQPLWPIGAALAILQISLFAFSQSTGLSVAGTFSRPDSPLRFIFYFLPIEYLSLIYLVLSHNIYWVAINGALYLGSSLGRGWSGGILLIALVVLARHSVSGRRIQTLLLVAAAGILAAATPLIFATRALIRQQLDSIEAAWQYLFTSTGDGNLFGYLIQEIGSRFQHYSVVAYVYLHRDALRGVYDLGGIREFWLDGSYGQAALSLYTTPAPELGLALIDFALGVDSATSAYNTHIGLMSWPILFPELIVPYIAYILLLGLVSLLLVRWAGSDKRLLMLTWFIWALLLMNGWFGAFITYLCALSVFVLLRYLGFVPVLQTAPSWRSSVAVAFVAGRVR